jgi:DNA-binding SARP family transcriptional activator/tetratricopeptide (TPR) repeat protein/DNA-binding XRE family transcriptional regulator
LKQLPSTLGELLHQFRVRASMTQHELAGRAGVSVRALRDLEHGRVRQPRPRSVQRLAAALGLADADRRRLLTAAGQTATSAGDAPLHVGVLGPLVVWRGDVPVAVNQPRLRSLLGLLAVQPGQVVPREELVDVLWGERPPDSCLALVHTYVAQLRGLLEPARQRRTVAHVLVRVPGGYRLELDTDQLDLLRFQQLAAQARQADLAGDPASAAALLGQALTEWRGPVLADLDPWMRQHPAAVELWQQRLDAALAYADHLISQGRGEEAVGPLRVLSYQEPLHEGLHARLMLALASCGQQAAALRLFVDLRGRLTEELGVEPGAEVHNVHLRILHQQLPAHDPPAISLAGSPGTDPATANPILTRERATPAQLPADVTAFTGRRNQLEELDELLEPGAEATAVVISAIAGTAGVGKTGLAVHWAHRVRDRFPDGQLYINLRGYAPAPPMRSIDALAGFLHALGVPAEQVPVDLDEAAGLYRTLLADKRMLVVLDNARAAEQVRPLLPGSPTCMVLVTSRDQLGGLVATHGARRLLLDALSENDAVTLLARVLGAERIAAEPAAATELAGVCACLPLALRIAAANLAGHPDWRTADYVARLGKDDQLAEMAVDGDPQAAVRTAFDCSYAALDPGAQRLFRLLGLVPGPEFTGPAAAALAGMSVRRAAQLLERLAAAHLVETRGPGRFGFHDLLRRYARQRAQHHDGNPERQAVISRLLTWYLHTADAAARLLYPEKLRLSLPPLNEELPVAGFDEHTGALAWLDAERANLGAAIRYAAEQGPYPMAWLLADTVRGYFWRCWHMVEWLAITRGGLHAAERAGDPRAQAAAHRNLGMARHWLGRYAQAAEHYRSAVAFSRQAGWVEGEAAGLLSLGLVCTDLGQLQQAAAHHTQALALNRQAGYKAGQAVALSNLGDLCREMGQLQQAAGYLIQAVALHREIGTSGQATTLDTLGEVYRELGRLDDACQHLTKALALARELGSRHDEAYDLHALAMVHRDAGRFTLALDLAQAALAVAREIREPRIEADALNALGSVHLCRRIPQAAMEHHRQALQVARQVGARYPQTEALLGLAAAHQHEGRHTEAVGCARQALTFARKAGYRILEGHAHTILAAAHLTQSQHDQAVTLSRQALRLHRQTGHRLGQARTLVILGHALRHTGRAAAALPCWHEALATFSEIGAPDADQVRGLLQTHSQPR